MKDWQWLRCQEVIDVRDGTHDTPKYVSSGIPFITSKDISNGFIDFSNTNFISEEDHKKFVKRSKVSKGDVLFAMIGTVGNPVLVETEAEFSIKNVAIFKLAENEKVNSNFFRHYLQSPQAFAQFQKLSKGGVQKFVSLDILRNLIFPVPPLSEQKRIAQVLDNADCLRRLRRHATQQTETFLQSVFIELFGNPRSNPMRWPTAELGDYIEFLTSGSRGWAQYYSTKGDLFLRIQNVGKNQLLLNDIAYVNAPDSAEARRTTVQEADLILSITADLGRTAVIPNGFPKAHINQHLALIRLKGICPNYVAGFMSSDYGQQQFNSLDREGVKSGLNFDNIREFKILIPPDTLQAKYSAILDQFRMVQSQHAEAERQAELLFQSLLCQAFTGQLSRQPAMAGSCA